MIERQECAHPFGVLPHPGCSWHTPRVIPIGTDGSLTPKTCTKNEETST